MDIKQILSQYQTLKSERRIYEPEWQEYVDTYMPGTQNFTSNTKPWVPVTNVATQGKNALNDLASTVFYGLISSGTKWFQLSSKEELDHEQKIQLEKLNTLILDIFVNVDNNFDQSFMKLITSAIALGSGCIHVNNDFGTDISFSHIPLSQYYIQRNMKGKVDVLFRGFKLNARQAIDAFGIKAVHENIIKAYEKNDLGMQEYVHCVWKNLYTGKFDAYYIDVDNAHEISKKEMNYFPFSVGFWAEHDCEVYGHGQAKIARSSMRYLSKSRMSLLTKLAFSANPPNLLPNDGVILDNISPGQNIYGGLDELTGQPRVVPMPIGGSSQDAFQMFQLEAEEVAKAFYLDKITPPIDKTRRTAYESALIEQGQRQALTPHVSSLIPVLTELVRNVILILETNGVLKQFTRLKDVEIEVEFLSRLAKLLKMEDVRSSQEFLQMSLPLLQFSPQLAGKFNFEKILEDAREGTGTPTDILRSDEEYAKILQAQAEQQQQQAQMQNALAASEIAKNTGGGVLQ